MSLASLERRIVRCRACPRLVRYLAETKARWPDHWCRPVPGFGDPGARIVLVGLAPGRHGSNRTGRMFTGDASGAWLYRALHETGFASRPVSEGPGDGLKLEDVWITAAARCAPPGNRPERGELDRCRPWLARELSLLPRARLFVAIGRIGHDAVLKVFGRKLADHPFGHGRLHDLGGKLLLDSYHCSRQNTNTGVLTWPMWVGIFRRAGRIVRPI
jgi:uracil-DNA glycosylase family 4